MTWVEIGRNDMGILNDTFKGYKKGASKFLFLNFFFDPNSNSFITSTGSKEFLCRYTFRVQIRSEMGD